MMLVRRLSFCPGWLPPGIGSGDVAGVWAPKVSVDFETSKLDISGSGGAVSSNSPPTFSTSVGWVFGGSKGFSTNINWNANYSFVVKFSSHFAGYVSCTEVPHIGGFRFSPNYNNSNSIIEIGGATIIFPVTNNGVIGISGNRFFNGNTFDTGGTLNPAGLPLCIGARMNGLNIWEFAVVSGSVQAIAVYKRQLTIEQALYIRRWMDAL